MKAAFRAFAASGVGANGFSANANGRLQRRVSSARNEAIDARRSQGASHVHGQDSAWA